MADNQELLALAAQLASDSDDCAGLTGTIRSATGRYVLSGGRFTDSVNELISLSETKARAIAADIDAVAAQLRRVDVVDLELEGESDSRV